MTRHRPAVLLLAAALTMGAADPPDNLKGPISDFWPRVKRDWSRRLTGLNRGPLQTAIWVAMIWDGPDEAILSVEDTSDALQEREAMRWLRAQITRHRWSEIASRRPERMQAMQQNVILLGTPEDNPLVGRALEATPLRVRNGTVTLAGRRIAGDGLLVLAIAPNPIDARHYALIITGTSPAAVAEAAGAPFGASDYMVLQGRSVVEQGMFRWNGGRPDSKVLLDERTFTPHLGWAARDFAWARLHHDARGVPAAVVDRAGEELDRALLEVAGWFGLAHRPRDPMEAWLYPSLEEKIVHTADARPAHMEAPTGDLHVVMPAGAAAWPDGALALAARRLLRQAAPWGPRADRELPGLAAAIGLIWRESFETIPLDAWAARSTRDPGLWPMGLLLSRQPTDPATGEFWTLDAASFLRSLATARGMEPLARWYRDARRADVHELFKEIYGESLRDAENRWLKSLKSGDAAARREPKGSSASAVHDPEAARLAAAARAAFREGAFDRAALLSEKVLAMEAASAEDKAWAGVTLGRAHARSGRHAAAIIWLRDERTRGGSETVRVLADYWLEILGRPLNGRAARDALMRDAELQLLGFDWEKAESSLQAALALDPLNRKAHTMLGQVYLSKFQYWYDFALLDRELHPSVSSADPYMYQYLADKGRTELARAETLPDDLPGNPAMLDAEDVALSTDSMASSHFLAGKAHYLRGDLEAARREMETVLELDRTRGSLPAYARLYLARVAQTRGDQEEARRQLEAIVKMAPAGRVTRLAREALEKLPPPAR